MTLSALILVAIALAAYANPVVLFAIWVGRLRRKPESSFRGRVGWASLILASAGFGVVVCFVTCGPEPATTAFDIWFRRCFWAAVPVCGLALVTGLAGKGRMQWLVPLSAIISPLTIVLGKVME